MDINKLYVHAVYMRLVYVHRIAIHGNISFYREKCNKTLSNQIDEKKREYQKGDVYLFCFEFGFIERKEIGRYKICFGALARSYGETIPIT